MPAYIGVNGKAKGIAKVYQGNSEGKAELIYAPKGVYKYEKEISPLSVARSELVAESTANKAVFAGGYDGTNRLSTVDAYDANLTRTIYTSMNLALTGMTIGVIGTTSASRKIFIMGGSDGTNYTNTCIAYDDNGTKTSITAMSVARGYASAAHSGYTSSSHRLYVAGGIGTDGYTVNNVDAYSSNGTKYTAGTLSAAKAYVGAAQCGTNVIFAGGWGKTSAGSYYYSSVDHFMSNSLTRKSLGSLTNGRYGICGIYTYYIGANAKHIDHHYALFAGGYRNKEYFTDIDAYNGDEVHTVLPTGLSIGRARMSATMIGEYTMFFGGYYYNSDESSYYRTSVIDVFDSNLSRVTMNLPESQYFNAATEVGNYALVGGGSGSAKISTVNAYYVWE